MAEDEAGPSNIRVICRFRPINEKEKQLFAEKQCVEFPKNNQTVIINPQSEVGGPLTFSFDYVFAPNSRQEDVYSIAAKPTIESVMQGFNGTVFAYGQTSSGKTHTMMGSDMKDPEFMGIIPRMVSTVFSQIELSDAKIEFQVKVGYCEIYLEKIKDLLDPRKNNLKVHEDRTRGVYIADLTEEYVSTGDEVYQLMKIGSDNREVAYTHMNAGSSRSHSIFILTIMQTNNNDYSAKTGKLYLVDLAGSEKVGKTGAAGMRLEEAKNINKSLTTLGGVIAALTDGKSSHVPYRDSKLTRVLQDSLGGNSKTSLIVTCSPSPFNESETISTLRFGVRAKAIKNKPKVNKEYTVNELKIMLSQAKEEIAKKDRVIASLKKAIESSGISVEINEKANNEEDEEEEPGLKQEEIKNSEVYAEIIIELEELRQKLADETRVSHKLKVQVENLSIENSDMKSDHEFIYKQIQDLQERKMITEEVLREKEELLEQLTVTNELLKNELSNEIDKRFLAESQLSEKTTEADSSHKAILKNLIDEKQKIADDLAEEISKNKKLIQEIDSINFELKKNLNDDRLVKVFEESHQQEKERWSHERRMMMNELNSRVKKCAELQLLYESEAEKRRLFEQQMPDGERALKKKSDTLERNVEQLNLMYHQLVSQKSMLKVDKQVADRKIARLNDRIANLEKAAKEANEKTARLEQENLLLKAEVQKCEQKVRQTLGPMPSTKIKKVIRGGESNTIFRTPASRRTESAIPESNKEYEIDD